ncbi:hypothetical protein [Terricaulis sp.]|uniref:hypothetical protein n=1 Tax=Terricaulis sp. TaxID=2768686 RepID=UPI0037830303
MKFFQIAIGAVIVLLGAMMLFVVLRDGGHDGGTGQAIMAPLGLIGAGALAISAARKRKK